MPPIRQTLLAGVLVALLIGTGAGYMPALLAGAVVGYLYLLARLAALGLAQGAIAYHRRGGACDQLAALETGLRASIRDQATLGLEIGISLLWLLSPLPLASAVGWALAVIATRLAEIQITHTARRTLLTILQP